MHIEKRCGCELPRQSCRLGRPCPVHVAVFHFLLVAAVDRVTAARTPYTCIALLKCIVLLLGYLVEVMDVYWKSGSYPKSVATFTHPGPTPTELTPSIFKVDEMVPLER